MRIRKSITALCFAGLAGLSSVTGCADNRTTFYVERALYVPPDGDCEVSVDLDGLQSGVMDLLLTGSYAVPVVVANQMQALGDPDRLRAETSIIQIEGFEVQIEGVNATPDTPSYSRRFTAVVNPSSGSTVGRAAVTLDLIPNGAITEPGSYLVSVIVFGTSLGGLGVETPEFVYPLEVCEGCLFTCAEDQAPACGFNLGNDFAHSCEFYGPGACDICTQ